MLYNRLRVLVHDHERPFDRMDQVARARLSSLFAEMGGEYAGWQGNSYGDMPNPTHLIMVNEPTDEQIAQMMLFALTSRQKHGVTVKVLREVKGRAGNQEISLKAILSQLASILCPLMLEPNKSDDVARCWNDLVIMAKVFESRAQQD